MDPGEGPGNATTLHSATLHQQNLACLVTVRRIWGVGARGPCCGINLCSWPTIVVRPSTTTPLYQREREILDPEMQFIIMVASLHVLIGS